MASAYGGHSGLTTVSANAENTTSSGLAITNLADNPPSNQPLNSNSSHSLRSTQDEQMHLVETQSNELMSSHQHNPHQQQQQQRQQHHHHLNSGISVTENLTNGDGRANGGLVMQSFTINPLNGRSSPTASGSSGGGSRSSAHSLPSHSPALHLSNQHNPQLNNYQTQFGGSLESCGPTTVVTSAAIMGRLTAGCVDSLGSAGSTARFTTVDNCGSDTLSLLQHHHAHPHGHHFSYTSLPPPPHHHHHHPLQHHHHLPHEAPGLLDISTL